jgi:hypothetical protein
MGSEFQNFWDDAARRLRKCLIACIDLRRWGHVAEWLRNGLQNRVHQFNSGRGLHHKALEFLAKFLLRLFGSSPGERIASLHFPFLSGCLPGGVDHCRSTLLCSRSRLLTWPCLARELELIHHGSIVWSGLS